jgi:subtilase family serine protease
VTPSAEGELYVDGTLLQTFSIPSLEPGEEERFSFNFQVLCSGEKDTIRVVVDSQNTVFESTEINNELEVELSFQLLRERI